MEPFSNLQNELEKFGLSRDQSALYLCLVQEGELRIQELAKRTELPRSTVYEHLKVLFKLGLAEEIIADNYKKIRAHSVSALKHDLSEQILHFQGLERDLEELEREFDSFAHSSSFPSMSVRYYKGIAGARQVFWNSLKARDMVYVYSAWGRSKYVGKRFYENFVDESKRRGIQENVLINPHQDTLDLLQAHLGTSLARTRLEDIRVIEEAKIRIIGETLIYDNVFAQIYLRGQEINGFEIENKRFTESQRSIFRTLRELGQPVESLL